MDEPLKTALSFGDEAEGHVVLRGRDLAALASEHTYEEMASILWDGFIVPRLTREALGEARRLAFARLSPMAALVQGRSAAEAMRMLVATCSTGSEIEALAWVGVSAALAVRAQDAAGCRPPDPQAGHAADLLAMATGVKAPTSVARAFERYCILMMDHGISASTYTARITASTGAGLASAMLAALCALEGVRHGGAPAKVLDQLDAIAGPGDAARYVAETRARGGRVIGFGSRAYAGRDLRSEMMKREWLAIDGASGRRSDAMAVEAALTSALAASSPQRALATNVEYYAALLLEAVGLPRHGFTPMFAAARAAGWAAHIAEQRRERRIIRPASSYVGPPLVG